MEAGQQRGIRIVHANLATPRHAQDYLALMDAYAADPNGGATPLDPAARGRLVAALREREGGSVILIAYASTGGATTEDAQAIGLATCFEAFSTFAARPILNLHDLVVVSGFRGRGVGRALLDEVERVARERGCCKLTLEVLTGNTRAQALYRDFGFSGYVLDPAQGHAVFWEKKLVDAKGRPVTGEGVV